ncbi:MAG: protein-L-isoaspartate O-methyltransferase [Gammaproteobacteria bacterium]|nr:protein-L-isoaspartate O-methyltransferase [Gammaproteobacteria bacterium]
MNLEQARFNMIEQQIRTWEVLDPRVLELLTRVPREQFAPAPYRGLAFADMNIPLGHGEVMMAPKVEARLIQALEVQAANTVLEIGTGSGYLTALLASLARHVHSVDIYPDFTAGAGATLAAQGIRNVTLETGDGANGWDRHAPYDVIAVTGSLPLFGAHFQEQLKVGGRLFMIVGQAPAMEALLITRLGPQEWSRESLFETDIPPLVNAPKPQVFVF